MHHSVGAVVEPCALDDGVGWVGTFDKSENGEDFVATASGPKHVGADVGAYVRFRRITVNPWAPEYSAWLFDATPEFLIALGKLDTRKKKGGDAV